MTVWSSRATDTIDEVFGRAVESRSEAVFLGFSGRIFTYGDVARRVARTASMLRDLGVEPGQTVVTMLDNNVDAVTVVLAAVRLGAIAMPVNTAYRGEFLRHQVADAGAAVVVAEAEYAVRTFLEHPDVAEVAVHAVPSEVTEDDVKVTAVPREGATITAEELCRWSIDRLPYFAVPRYIEFRESLPRNPVGRILKYELRAQGVTPSTWDREASDVLIGKR